VSRIKDELLLGALQSSDLEGLVQTVLSFARESLPLASRSPALLNAHRERLRAACEKIFYDTVAADNARPNSRPKRSAKPGDAEFRDTLLQLAAELADNAPNRPHSQSLREGADILTEAAGLLARQRWSELLARDVRRLEAPESPPAASFLANGQMLWANSALLRLTHARDIDHGSAIETMTDFAATVAEAHADEAVLSPPEHRLEGYRVYLFGDVRTDGLIGDLTVEIRASEVRRKLELTDRELQVARLIAESGSYRATAESLGIAIDTVRSHIRRVYRKLGVHDRVGLRARLRHNGLLD
jgi:DNA-binding CsgD family transcriptional regulator